MPSSITQSQLLPILGAVVAFLFAALLLLYIFRLLFGRRIKAPGPRNRARRLDIVDTFDLDRERQLVIVRRDNTEHLVLIGGPNDVLIEASINRIEGREARPLAAREKETATGPGWPGAPLQAPPAPPPPIGPTATPPIFAEPPKRKTVEAPPPVGAPPAAPPLQPLPPDLFAPPPPKPAPEPQPARPAAPPRFAPPPPPPSRTTGTGFTPTPRPPRPAPPPFLSRAQRPAGPAPASEPPPPPVEAAPPHEPPLVPPQEPPVPPPAAEQAPPPAPAEAPAPPPAPVESADPLESLEAEMARLLGRPESKP